MFGKCHLDVFISMYVVYVHVYSILCNVQIQLLLLCQLAFILKLAYTVTISPTISNGVYNIHTVPDVPDINENSLPPFFSPPA